MPAHTSATGTRPGSSTPQPPADPPVSDPAVSTPSRLRLRLRKGLGALLAFGLLLAAGYGAGQLHAWFSLRARREAVLDQLESERREGARAQGELRAQLARSAEQVEQLRAQRAQLQAVTALHEGYRLLQQALDALDARNFGTAESRIREAEQVLAATQAEVAGVPALVGRIGELRISVASDLAPQRGAVRALSRELSALIDDERTALKARAASP
jgi:chromosome segregation ATPase